PLGKWTRKAWHTGFDRSRRPIPRRSDTGFSAARHSRRRRLKAIQPASLRCPVAALLAPVVAVDLDVALCQVAGPDHGGGAADADVDGDLQFLALHVVAHLGLAVGRRDQAVAG